jgi:hypothetical protein
VIVTTLFAAFTIRAAAFSGFSMLAGAAASFHGFTAGDSNGEQRNNNNTEYSFHASPLCLV